MFRKRLKRMSLLFIFLVMLLLVACHGTIDDSLSTTSPQPTDEDPTDEFVISDPSETRDTFDIEPMRTKLVEVDGIHVVYQYDQPVPSFDTWETQEEGRNHLSLNGEWYFKTDPENIGVQEKWYSPYYDHTSWEKRPVPSSWDVYDYNPKNRWGEGYPFYDGYAWYVRTFELDESWMNRYIKINFLGVNYRSWIYVNGQFIEAHESGNTAFSIDITDYVRKGSNTIAVRVYRRPDFTDYIAVAQAAEDERSAYRVYDDNALPHGPVDYWPYAGITRDVYLEGTNKLTVSKILIDAKYNVLHMYAVIYNTDAITRTIAVEFDPGKDTGGQPERETLTIAPNAVRVLHKKIDIPDAKEWSYVQPQLYTGYVRLYEDEQLIDSLHVTYGMREFKVSGTSILLNGQQIFLKGTNWHEETKKSGRSLSKEEYDLELGLIKEMNMNFMRNSHYNRHPYAYEYADRHGILVMDESENMWLSANAIRRQYRTYKLSHAVVMMTTWNQHNHPSVVIWSLCNEVSYDGDYIHWIQELYQLTKMIDIQKRPVTWAAVNADDPAFKYADIIGFNEYAGFFWGKNEDLTGVLRGVHNRYPNKPVMITENGTWSVWGNLGRPNATGSEHWQAANFRSHYQQTIEHKDFMVGYTFWLLKDYKTRNGYNFESVGISTMGTVPFDFSKEFVENAKKFGVDPYKVVFYSIQNAENPYEYIVT